MKIELNFTLLNYSKFEKYANNAKLDRFIFDKKVSLQKKTLLNSQLESTSQMKVARN